MMGLIFLALCLVCWLYIRARKQKRVKKFVMALSEEMQALFPGYANDLTVGSFAPNGKRIYNERKVYIERLRKITTLLDSMHNENITVDEHEKPKHIRDLMTSMLHLRPETLDVFEYNLGAFSTEVYSITDEYGFYPTWQKISKAVERATARAKL